MMLIQVNFTTENVYKHIFFLFKIMSSNVFPSLTLADTSGITMIANDINAIEANLRLI